MSNYMLETPKEVQESLEKIFLLQEQINLSKRLQSYRFSICIMVKNIEHLYYGYTALLEDIKSLQLIKAHICRDYLINQILDDKILNCTHLFIDEMNNHLEAS